MAVESFAVCDRRRKLLAEGTLKPLPEPSETAADQCYVQTTARLCEGLEKVLEGYGDEQRSREEASRGDLER